MNSATGRSSPWLWEELDPGLSFEPQTTAITGRDADLWRGVSSGDDRGAGGSLRALLVPAMMRAFIAASDPRVPGNIHVSQDLSFPGRSPRTDEALIFTFTVASRAERKGRGWVDILVDCRAAQDGEALMRGRMVLIWAGRRASVDAQHA